MIRLSTVMLAAVLTLGACAPAAIEGPPGTEASAPTQETPVAEGEDPATTTTEPPQAVEGPPAPDFTLELATGETFRLSEERDPVYLVFWAEW